MKNLCVKDSKVLYLVPTRQALISLLRILFGGAIHENDYLMHNLLVLEPSDEPQPLPPGLREKCFSKIIQDAQEQSNE
jgi:hypothetical protein